MYAADHGIAYVETSGLHGTNVPEAFELIINEIYRVLRQEGDISKSMDTSNPTGMFKTSSGDFDPTSRDTTTT